jgi:hypothetical protein
MVFIHTPLSLSCCLNDTLFFFSFFPVATRACVLLLDLSSLINFGLLSASSRERDHNSIPSRKRNPAHLPRTDPVFAPRVIKSKLSESHGSGPSSFLVYDQNCPAQSSRSKVWRTIILSTCMSSIYRVLIFILFFGLFLRDTVRS